MATNTHRTSAALRRASLASRILVVQVLIGAGACALAALVGSDSAWSALWGAVAAVATTAYFARRVFAPVPRGPQAAFAGSLVRAAVVRVAMAASAFVAAFAVLARVDALALVGAYVVVHVGGSLAALGEGGWTTTGGSGSRGEIR